jgi:threonine aldolase
MPWRVDLRSDTVTRPTPEMYAAMARAPLGDDVLGDDPTVRELELMTADCLGHQDGLFVPSGTMGNQVALAVHTSPGDSALFEEQAHMLYYEGGAPAVMASVLAMSYPTRAGEVDIQEVERRVLARSQHTPGTTCICLENTHNRHGGSVTGPETMHELRIVAEKKGAAFHVDGARLWNAAVALGVEPKDLAREAHSVSVCLSKGLGAPVGSVLVGDKPFIEEARFWRKRMGGGMRQSGLLAACGIVALDRNIDRLAEDHARARRLAESLAEIEGLRPVPPATNIVIVETDSPADVWVETLSQKGVAAVPFGPHRVRFVTHYDIDDDAISFAIATCRAIVEERFAVSRN